MRISTRIQSLLVSAARLVPLVATPVTAAYAQPTEEKTAASWSGVVINEAYLTAINAPNVDYGTPSSKYAATSKSSRSSTNTTDGTTSGTGGTGDTSGQYTQTQNDTTTGGNQTEGGQTTGGQ